MLIVKVTEVHQLEKGSKFVLSFPHPKAGFTIMLPDPSPIYKHSSIHLSIHLNTHALIYSFIYSFTEQCIEHPLCAKVTREKVGRLVNGLLCSSQQEMMLTWQIKERSRDGENESKYISGFSKLFL